MMSALVNVVTQPSPVYWLSWSVFIVSGLPCRAIASSSASTQKLASSVFESRQDSTLRHDRYQIQKAMLDWDVGDVAAPNLSGPRDCQLSQQIGIDPMLRVFLAGVWALINGLQTHNAHQATHTMPPRREPGLGKISCNLAAAKERILRKYPVNLMHQIKRRGIKADRRVIVR